MKCPHCDKPIMTVTMEEVEGRVLFGKTWRCVAYGCPLCQKVISVEIDPIALKTDILSGVAQLLGKRYP